MTRYVTDHSTGERYDVDLFNAREAGTWGLPIDRQVRLALSNLAWCGAGLDLLREWADTTAENSAAVRDLRTLLDTLDPDDPQAAWLALYGFQQTRTAGLSGAQL